MSSKLEEIKDDLNRGRTTITNLKMEEIQIYTIHFFTITISI